MQWCYLICHGWYLDTMRELSYTDARLWVRALLHSFPCPPLPAASQGHFTQLLFQDRFTHFYPVYHSDSSARVSSLRRQTASLSQEHVTIIFLLLRLLSMSQAWHALLYLLSPSRLFLPSKASVPPPPPTTQLHGLLASLISPILTHTGVYPASLCMRPSHFLRD